MLYALMCEDSAAGGHETRAAVNGVLDDWADGTGISAPAGPDPETWGLRPEHIAAAEAADRLADAG